MLLIGQINGIMDSKIAYFDTKPLYYVIKLGILSSVLKLYIKIIFNKFQKRLL